MKPELLVQFVSHHEIFLIRCYARKRKFAVSSIRKPTWFNKIFNREIRISADCTEQLLCLNIVESMTTMSPQIAKFLVSFEACPLFSINLNERELLQEDPANKFEVEIRFFHKLVSGIKLVAVREPVLKS